jgi:hypothetical protein
MASSMVLGDSTSRVPNTQVWMHLQKFTKVVFPKSQLVVELGEE